MPTSLPTRARVVVIGGGVIGCSVAYHLAQLGWRDVVLVERDKLTSGTTWHAAGLMVTFGSMSSTSTELRIETRDLYARLEAETGQATGFAPVGFIELAADDDRLEEYRRVAAFNRFHGVDVHEISAREVAERFPLARVDDIRAGFYVADDGRVNPVDVTMALARGARQGGVTVAEGVAVTGLRTRAGAVTAVETDHGAIECEYAVLCTGMWARQQGDAFGITIPLQAAEHYYMITDAIDGLTPDLPVIEDPSSYGYYREEVGGLMVGLFEPECAPWHVDAIPDDASFTVIQPDWDRMGPYVERALSRVPAAVDTGIRTFFCGPESFTPDLSPIVGEAPEVRNLFVAAGLNSIGILTGGGLGRVVAQWIVDGRPDVDVTGIHIDRLHPWQATPEYRRTRTVESLGLVYQAHYPTRALRTARGVLHSPVHERLGALGAHFRDVTGWEGADWYAGPGVVPDPGPLTWGRPRWFGQWEAEHRATRENVIVMDMSFMAKLTVEGPDAARVLERVSANQVSGVPERITYTQWLNDGGTIEADLTVTQRDDARFWVVASDTAHRHALTWLRRHVEVGERVDIDDVTNAYAQLNVQGPRSRELLQSITETDLSNDAFPYRCAREVSIGYARVLCVRITYLGELGYELYVPAPQALDVYDRIWRAGRAFDLAPAGLKALASLRMEKGYRDYGHDIDNTDDPFEAGLGFAVALDKPGGFVGREAVLARRADGPSTRRLVQVLLRDPEPLLYHGEIVRADGDPVGYVRAASYGHTLGAAVGLAMVDLGEPVTQAALDARTLEVEIAGRRIPAVASLRPLYDPKMDRIKA